MKEKLRLYHTNDLHSHFENWPKIVDYIEQKRKEHQSDSEETLVFDIGDHLDRFQFVTEATFGKANVDLLNRLHIDGAAIGNNEGITLPHEELAALYDHAEFPVIVSNLYDKTGNRPSWAVPYHIKSLKNGMSIAFLGVTVPYYPVYDKLGWTVTDALESIKETIQEVKGQADIIVLLSHLGILDDQAVAEAVPEIDVILESHTHHLLEDGQVVNGVLLASAEKYGHYVGCVEITVDSVQRSIISKTASVQNMAEWPGESAETKAFLNEKEREAEEKLSDAVAELAQDAEVKWFEESERFASGVRVKGMVRDGHQYGEFRCHSRSAESGSSDEAGSAPHLSSPDQPGGCPPDGRRTQRDHCPCRFRTNGAAPDQRARLSRRSDGKNGVRGC